jgi:hypothetical protein
MATSGNSSSGGVPVLTPVSETSQLAGFDALVVVASSFAEGSLHAVLEPFAKAIALAQKVSPPPSPASFDQYE